MVGRPHVPLGFYDARLCFDVREKSLFLRDGKTWKQYYTSISFLLGGIIPMAAQPLTSKQVDELVEKTLKAFDVPGIAVGIVKDGKLIHAKGYGMRSLNTGQKWMRTLCSVLHQIAKHTLLLHWPCW